MIRNNFLSRSARARLGAAPAQGFFSMRLLLAAMVLVGALAPALAHDSWISNQARRNAAGEWCCGEGDCFVIPNNAVASTAAGYRLSTGEIVPYSEAQPSPDGAFWRCKRPDGSRRCFFAPPPTD